MTEPEAAIGPPTSLGDGRVVLAQQGPNRLWVVDLTTGEIDELASAGGRVEGVVDGVVILRHAAMVRGVDVDADTVLWEARRASDEGRLLAGQGALVALDRDIGRISLLDPHRGDVRWSADVPAGVDIEVAAVGGTLAVTTSMTMFVFDLATGDPHGWTTLIPDRAEPVGGTHRPVRCGDGAPTDVRR